MSVGVGVAGIAVLVGVSFGDGATVGVAVPEEPGLIEMPPMAQWSPLPREALRVRLGPAPPSVTPAPIVLPPPARRFQCSTAAPE